MSLAITLLALVGGCIGVLLYSGGFIQLLRYRGMSLPPGPPGHWLLGNAPPGPHACRRFADLTEVYGPVFTLRYGSRIVCVIGRYQAAMDILMKRSAETADRPRAVAGNEILSKGLRILLTPIGERLKRNRKALHAYLQPSKACNYKPTQLKNAKNYIRDCLDDPGCHKEHAKRYAASVSMAIAYGKTTPSSYSDPDVQAVSKVLYQLSVVMRPGAYLVDTFPILKYIPGYLSDIRSYQKEELGLYRSQLDLIRQKLARGESCPSFAAYLLENQKSLGLSDDETAYLAGAIFGAGADTTASAISVVTMAAACYPEAQARVQAQLDKVVGRERAPTFEDEPLLPEVSAFVLETYRWRPITAGGFPHRTTKDIIWKDYVIPAGAEIIGNHWAIARDPEIYPEPEKFNPQRWLTEDGRLRNDLKFVNWGFGRRVCAGSEVADNSLFINTALVLWAFNLSQDPSRPIDDLAFTDTANLHPLPFALRFKTRVENVREILGE